MNFEKMPYFEADDGTQSAGSDTGADTGAATETGDSAQSQAETIKVKFLEEEKEIPISEAAEWIQKGMNHDRIKEKYESSKGTVSAIEAIARRAGFVDENGHGDVSAYTKAANEMLEQTEKEKMFGNIEIPKELADEIYELKKDKDQRKAFEAEQAKKDAEEQQFADLLVYFEKVNGRKFDINTDKLPAEVLTAPERGTTPRAAYAEYFNQQLLEEKRIANGNAENAAASAGSTSGKGVDHEKEFYTSQELDKLTEKDLDDPNIFEKARRSMIRLK